MIFSIGYQRLTAAQIASLAEQLDAVVWDVRGVPVSRKPGFGRRQLETTLGDRYEWRGATLGNKGANSVTSEGLAELAAESRHVILMCQEEAPGECHRHHKIALPLLSHGVHVMHIYQDELIDSAEFERSAVADDDYECVSLSDFIATVAA